MRVTNRWTRRGVVVGMVAGCSCLLLAGLARAAEPPPPNLNELWEEYPLEPPATSPEIQPAPTPEPAPAPAPVPPTGEGGTEWKPFALGAAGGGLLLILLCSSVVLVRSRRRPTPAPGRQETPAELIERAYALAKEAAECDKLLAGKRNEGDRGMTGTTDRHRSSAPAKPSERDSSNYADIGERVAGVLAAAEAAANQIREDARLSVEEILSAAREEADDVRRKAAAYDTDTRATVDSFAEDRRRDTELEIQKQLAESEAQARATRQAVEAMAHQIEEDGKRRQALRDESKVVEQRLKKALVGLRRMTMEIEQLLGPTSEDGESLEDALKVYGQRTEDGPVSPLVAALTDET